MDKKYAIAALAIALTIVVAAIIVFDWNNHPNPNQSNSNEAIAYTYSIVNTYPHDTSAYTEGLLFSDGMLFESTGEYGQSSLRRVNLGSGVVSQEYKLPDEYFGEGLATVDNSLVQLTWLEKTGFIYNKETFELQRNFSYSTQGWGLTYDGNRLIMSDGSSTLTFLDRTTYQAISQINVTSGDNAVVNINELEYINGTIYANIWHSMSIAIINPVTGQVNGWIDLTGIYEPSNYDSVLNGIAYDAQTGRLFVTGKNWPNLYEITIQAQD